MDRLSEAERLRIAGLLAAGAPVWCLSPMTLGRGWLRCSQMLAVRD